jgi:hypothetical protein
MALDWLSLKISTLPLTGASFIVKAGPLIGAVMVIGVLAVPVLNYYLGEPTLPLPFN